MNLSPHDFEKLKIAVTDSVEDTVSKSHISVANTVSGLGHEMKEWKIKNDGRFDTIENKLSEFINESKLNRKDIDLLASRLNEDELTVKIWYKSLKKTLGVAVTVIITLIGIISTLGSMVYNGKNEALASQMDLKIAAHEKDDREAVNEIKDYINKITKKDLISINNGNQ